MSRSSALALTLLGVVVVIGGVAYATTCTAASYLGCFEYDYTLYGFPVAVAGAAVLVVGLVLWGMARDDQLLQPATPCPVCRQPMVWDAHTGVWYCARCARRH